MRKSVDKPDTTSVLARGRFALGLALSATGIAFAAYGLLHPSAPIQPDPFIALPIGMIFASAGVLLAFPSAGLELKTIFATLLITGFAVTFDWIAFGPGERHFSGSLFRLLSASEDPTPPVSPP